MFPVWLWRKGEWDWYITNAKKNLSSFILNLLQIVFFQNAVRSRAGAVRGGAKRKENAKISVYVQRCTEYKYIINNFKF